MKTSDTIKELSTALSQAQAAMRPAAANSVNPHFKSNYADLASIWNACREPLTKNGLAVVQTPDTDDRNNVVVTTRLTHISGEWVESALAIPIQKPTPQGIGSLITYARRYALAAIVGVAPEGDDDDGEGAEARQAKPSKPQDRPAEVIDQICLGAASDRIDTYESAADLTSFMAEVANSPANTITRNAIKSLGVEKWKKEGWTKEDV